MLMKMRSKMQNQKGFTLVELMVVVVILGILVAIAVPVYNSVTVKAEKSAIMANLRTINGAVMMYYTDEDNADLTADADGVAALVTKKYLATTPEGPGDCVYVLEGVAPQQIATVSSTEKAGGIVLNAQSLEELQALGW